MHRVRFTGRVETQCYREEWRTNYLLRLLSNIETLLVDWGDFKAEGRISRETFALGGNFLQLVPPVRDFIRSDSEREFKSLTSHCLDYSFLRLFYLTVLSRRPGVLCSFRTQRNFPTLFWRELSYRVFFAQWWVDPSAHCSVANLFSVKMSKS